MTEADSATDAGAVSQALGLIATVQAREELSQEWALLGGMLAGDQLTKDERIAFTEAAATRQAELDFRASHPDPGQPGRLQRRPGRFRPESSQLERDGLIESRGFPRGRELDSTC